MSATPLPNHCLTCGAERGLSMEFASHEAPHVHCRDCGDRYWLQEVDGAWVARDTRKERQDRMDAVVRWPVTNAVGRAVAELDAEHRPMWASPQGGFTHEPVEGREPVGCAICYPGDGSWPCTTRMVVDEHLRGWATSGPPR
jgi:hypothetical protein